MKIHQFFLAAFIALGLLLSVAVVSTREDVILLFVSVAAAIVVSYPILTQSNYYLFQPITFVFISVLMGCTLKAFYIIAYQGSNEIIDTKLLLDLGVESLLFGSAAVTLGLIFFLLGYQCIFFRSSKILPIRTSWSIRKIGIVSTGLLLIVAIAFVGFVGIMGISFQGLEDLSVKRFRDEDGTVTASRTGTLAYLFYRLALLAKIPFYLLVVVKIKRGFRWSSYFGILLIFSGFLSVFVPFFMNNRAGILLPVFDVLMITYIMRGRLNWQFLFTVGGAAIALVLLGGVLRSGGDLSRFYDLLFGGRYLIDVTKTAHIISHYNDYAEKLYGTTFFNWVYQILPFLQPVNPEQINLGQYLGYTVFGYAASGVPPGIIAELHMNFGWAGITLGMFIVGVVLKVIYVYYRDRLANPEAVIIYTLICTRFSIFLFNNGFSIALMKTALDVIAFIVLFMFIRGGQGNRKATLSKQLS